MAPPQSVPLTREKGDTLQDFHAVGRERARRLEFRTILEPAELRADVVRRRQRGSGRRHEVIRGQRDVPALQLVRRVPPAELAVPGGVLLEGADVEPTLARDHRALAGERERARPSLAAGRTSIRHFLRF